ncbi:MAG: glycosyltransferase family 2 protein [Mucilaginibacter sp.]|nr:glycosyltransferase family 2 protein [Mucilaginibacter sp.]
MVSVIIPCHNCAGFIDRAIKSVMAQSYKDVEIILVENNSTDNTLRVLQKYRSLYPQLISVLIEFTPGAPAARNCGLKMAKGEWIQFLDADDELLIDKISTQLNAAELAGADVVAGASLLKYNTPKKSFDIERQVDEDVWKGLITSNLGITSSNLWRKDALVEVGGWDERISSSQEYDLLFRLIKKSAVVIVDHHLDTIVHFSQNSVSKSTNKEKFEKIIGNRLKLRVAIKEELKAKGILSPQLNTAIDKYIYNELISNSDKIPEFCANYLKSQDLTVGLETTIRIKAHHYLKRVRNALNI